MQDAQYPDIRNPSMRLLLFDPLSGGAQVRAPVALTGLIDRTQELADIVTLLRGDEVRLLTLTGTGGVGKTRLAIAAASELVDDFPNGIAFVGLAAIADARLVVPTIARTFGLRDMGDEPLQRRLINVLTGRRLLLILDNFEHVIGAGPEIHDLLAACPDISVLITSRVRLRLSGEQDFPISPLPLPVPVDVGSQLGDNAAMQLFVERVQEISPGFVLGAEAIPSVAEIVRRVDGLPLAIELAAARVKVLPPAALLQRMEQRLPLLSGGARDLPHRQQTMRNTIAWSYDLLTPADQALFRRLAVFAGGFALEAAEAIGAVAIDISGAIQSLSSVETLDGIAALIDHNLLWQGAGPADEPRFHMLETVREYGLERLQVSSAEEHATRRTHAAYAAVLAESISGRAYPPRFEEALPRLDAELDNIRAALRWTEEAGETELGLQLAADMNFYWTMRGHYEEGRGWMERGLRRTDGVPAALCIAAMTSAGWLAEYQGDYEAATTLLTEAVRLAQAQNDQQSTARAFLALGQTELDRGNYQQAATLTEESVAQFLRLEASSPSHLQFLNRGYTNLGRIAFAQQNFEQAAGALEEALRRARARGYVWGLGDTLRCLGDLARERGEFDQALAFYHEGVDLAKEHGDRRFLGKALSGIAVVAAVQGRMEPAVRLAGAAAAMRQQLGVQVEQWQRSTYDHALDRARSAMTPEAFAAAWAAGFSLPPAVAIAEALAVAAPVAPAVGDTYELSSTLVGRNREMGMVGALLDHIQERGGALVVRGEAGIGKSALLSFAQERARTRNMTVLSLVGIQTEAQLPFAGLHQLLRPIWARVADLPAPQRSAVLAAFGMTDSAAPDVFFIALAVLDLLADAATHAPVLVVVDDAHWVDRATHTILGFVARRLVSEPVVVLFGVRDGIDNPLDEAGLPELRLDRLNEAAAGTLLDARAPDLPPAVRQRLLDEAAGNPLAIIELPTALGLEHRWSDGTLPAWLPLTTRLERTFTARTADLPAATRALLLVAAVDDGSTITEIMSAAATIVGGTHMVADALQPAIDSGMITVDDLDIRFRHPLVRSAVYQVASTAQRRATHAALAAALADQPDRRTWHRAAATIGADETVAAELDEAATRALHRGGHGVAVTTLERAAQFSEDPDRRAARLLSAADLAINSMGWLDKGAQLVDAAEQLPLSHRNAGMVTWLRDRLHNTEDLTGPRGVGPLVEVVEQIRTSGNAELAFRMLWTAAYRCWDADLDPEMRARVCDVADQMAAPNDHSTLLSILAFAAPVERGKRVIDQLSRVAPEQVGNAGSAAHFGMAAVSTGAFEIGLAFFVAAATGLRADGRLAILAQVLTNLAWTQIHVGNWNAAMLAAEEAGRLGHTTLEPLRLAHAIAAEAVVAGVRGDHDRMEACIADVERLAVPRGAAWLLAHVQIARGLTALGTGHYRDAYTHLRRLFDLRDPAYHRMERLWVLDYLIEAAVYGGFRTEVSALIAEIEPLANHVPSTRLALGLRYARAVIANDNDADALFQAALSADLTGWPFARARLQLAYGTWLRRQRRVAESRPCLRAARDAFDALGAPAWSERARQELRAAGESSRRRTPDALDLLTTQELHIAQLAASGLSNREIGQRLYLSHRTIGAHLYRIFPKLGITSRAELQGALNAGMPLGT